MALIKCPHCGSIVSDNDEHCPECSKALEKPSVPPPTSNFNRQENEILYNDAAQAKEEGRLEDAKTLIDLLLRKAPDNERYRMLQTMIENRLFVQTTNRLKALYHKAETAISQGNVTEAHNAIQEAYDIEGDNERIKALRDKLQAYLDAQEAERRRKKRKTRTIIWSIILLILLAAGGVAYYFYYQMQAEDNLWKDIQSDPSQTLVEQYMKEYPSGKHIDEAKDLLIEFKAWNETRNTNNFQNYLAFIQKYPDSPLNSKARSCADSLLWSAAKFENSEERYAEYLQYFEDGVHAAEAKEELKGLNEMKVSEDDAIMVNNTLSGFFNALSYGQDDITNFVAPTMVNFFGHQHATKADALALANKMVSSSQSHFFTINDDVKITKSKDDNNNFIYNVTCSVDERRTQNSNDNDSEEASNAGTTFISYKATIQLDDNGKIIAINMQKLSGY